MVALFVVDMMLLAPATCFAQLDSAALATKKEFTAIEDALKEPLNVYKLNLRKQKLKKIPTEIFQFTNLQELDLSRNKITEIPEEIGLFVCLEKLDLSRNKLVQLPEEIGKLSKLKKLLLYLNEIPELPASIGKLGKLQVLDLWGNEITELPEEIKNLKHSLRLLDMRVISIPANQQEKIVLQLPFTTIYFSQSCNCR